MSAAPRLTALYLAKYPHADSAQSADRPPYGSNGTKGTIGIKPNQKIAPEGEADTARFSRAHARAYWSTNPHAPEQAAPQTKPGAARRLNKRSPSWSSPNDEPQAGDFCACCEGSRWWSDTDPPRGWCCTTCHPPCHLQAAEFRVVAT